MERINIHNYEAWLLDLAEGRLSEQDLTMLKEFVLAHPELGINLEEGDLPALENEVINSDFKHTLRKTEEDALNDELLHYLEGLLSKEKSAAFKARLEADPLLRSELELFHKTRLAADVGEIFRNKAALKKSDEELLLDDKVIAYIEDLLPAVEKKLLEMQAGKDLQLKRELELVQKTILKPDLTVVYHHKSRLKKRATIIPLFTYRVLRVAAVLAAVAGIATLLIFRKNDVVPMKETASAIKIEKPVQPQLKVRTEQKKAQEAPRPLIALQKKSTQQGSTISSPLNQVSKQDTSTQDLPMEIPKLAHHEVLADSAKNDKITVVKSELIPQAAASEEVLEPMSDLAWLEEEETVKEPARRGFLQRVAALAGQANKLGVQAVDGVAGVDDSYKLTLFSYSIEKK